MGTFYFIYCFCKPDFTIIEDLKLFKIWTDQVWRARVTWLVAVWWEQFFEKEAVLNSQAPKSLFFYIYILSPVFHCPKVGTFQLMTIAFLKKSLPNSNLCDSYQIQRVESTSNSTLVPLTPSLYQVFRSLMNPVNVHSIDDASDVSFRISSTLICRSSYYYYRSIC